jgi:hypothetical protein
MFESIISDLIEDLKCDLGSLFSSGFYKKPYDENGINSDLNYQFYIADTQDDQAFEVEVLRKNDPTFFEKEFKLVVQFTNRIDKDLLVKKTINVLNKVGAKSIRFIEDSKIIQDQELRSKPAKEIPLIMFIFAIRKGFLFAECCDPINEIKC